MNDELVNKDKVSGKLEKLHDNLLTVATGQGSLDIPLSRVSQISLGNPTTTSPPDKPWELRAYFAGGGTVSFELEQWQHGKVWGRSTNFGQIDFDPQFVRQLQFNLARPRTAGDEMEILDQDVWELE